MWTFVELYIKNDSYHPHSPHTFIYKNGVFHLCGLTVSPNFTSNWNQKTEPVNDSFGCVRVPGYATHP